MLGEIWVCSGQSNMEFEMMHVQNSKEEISRADYPQLRMLLVPRTTSAVPLNDVKTSWAICSPASEVLPKFSAVAYFFGREILTNLKVPVGLMAASQGATQIEPWTAHEGVAEGGALYNGMIHPLVPFAIRGAIWYQGESNCGDGMRYFDKMKALVSGWRRVWQQGDFPFYFVQITPNRYDGALPLLIESQIASMTIPNTGMAQSTDTTNPSDNFGGGHPRNKQEIGRRLALWALAKDYGQINLVHSGPRFQSLKAEGSHLRISFDQVGGGLITRDNKAPDSFEIAGPDGVFVEATARIDGATVIVSSEKVAQPKAMRFAWTDLAQPNLMIKDGLPVSQFRAQVP